MQGHGHRLGHGHGWRDRVALESVRIVSRGNLPEHALLFCKPQQVAYMSQSVLDPTLVQRRWRQWLDASPSGAKPSCPSYFPESIHRS